MPRQGVPATLCKAAGAGRLSWYLAPGLGSYASARPPVRRPLARRRPHHPTRRPGVDRADRSNSPDPRRPGREGSHRRAGGRHRPRGTGDCRGVVPERRAAARRSRVPLPAPRRGRVHRLLAVARRSGAAGRDDGCRPGAQHLRVDRAATPGSGADRAGRPWLGARPGVPHRAGRDAQDHVAVYPGARPRRGRVAVPVSERSGHGSAELPLRDRQRHCVRRSIFAHAPGAQHPPRRPPRGDPRRFGNHGRRGAVPAAGGAHGRVVARHAPATGRGRVFHAAAVAGSRGRRRGAASRPRRGPRRVRLDVRGEARASPGGADSGARHAAGGRPLPPGGVLERRAALSCRMDGADTREPARCGVVGTRARGGGRHQHRRRTR